MVQCWVGYQTKAATQEQAMESDIASPFILAHTEVEVQSLGRLGHFMDMPEAERIALAQAINEAGLSYTASPYLDGFDAPEEETNLA